MDTTITQPASAIEIKLLPINQLKPNPWNRTVFDPDAMKDLVASLKAVGVKEPLIVRSLDDGSYQIASGHRRWLAAKEAGLSELPCYIEALPDQEVAEDNITINIQRENIPPLELARMVKGYMDQFSKTQQDAAQKFGKSQPWVSDLTGFLKLPQEVQENIRALIIGWDALTAIKRCPTDIQLRVSEELKAGSLKPMDVDKRCRQLNAGKVKTSSHRLRSESLPDPLADVWQQAAPRLSVSGIGFWGVTYGPQEMPNAPGVSMPAWHFWIADQGSTPQSHLKKWFQELANAMGDGTPTTNQPVKGDVKGALSEAEIQALLTRAKASRDNR